MNIRMIRWQVLSLVMVGSGYATAGAQTDTAPPIVSISSPAANARVGGKVALTVSATDNVGVTEVSYFKNGSLLDTSTAAPFGIEVDFNSDPPDKDYVLKVSARDAAGNTAEKSITVNKPRLDLRGPGGTLADNGAFFKVWAPHAKSVAVMGDFNGWNEFSHFLWHAGDWWYGFQPNAQAGHRYKFAIANAPATPAGPPPSLKKPDPWGKLMEGSSGASILVDPNFDWTDGSWKTPAFENMIIYELHVGTFVGKNDGQHYPGNLENLATKLDYIKSIGANMIEVLPMHEVPGPDGNTPYLGYAPTGLFAVESSYKGTALSSYKGLQNFVNLAHARGIGVIMDVVYNHFSDAGGRDNWYWNYDGDSEHGDGGIYFAGNNTQWGPAPDWGRAEVRDYIKDNTRYWLRDFHLDGLRWDVTAEIKNKQNGAGWNAMRDIVSTLKQEFPGRIQICENLPYEKPVVEGDAGSPNGGFHAGWWVDFNHKLQEAFKRGKDADLGEAKLGINGGDYSHVTKRVVYAISHDEARNGRAYLTTEFGGRGNWDARAKARAMGALLFFTPGIPMLWQGEEFAQDDWFNDDFEHAPNWRYETDTEGSQMKQLYRDAITLRWRHDVLRTGGLEWTHEDPNRILAFRRDAGNQSILVVVNFSDTSYGPFNYGVSTGGKQGQWTQILCSQDAPYGGWDGAGNAFHEPWTGADGKIFISVPKESVVAFKLK
jgi:1,4-alpha-glucan branching enzyme